MEEGSWAHARSKQMLPIPLSFLARAGECRLQTSAGLGHTVNRQTGMVSFFFFWRGSQNVGVTQRNIAITDK